MDVVCITFISNANQREYCDGGFSTYVEGLRALSMVFFLMFGYFKLNIILSFVMEDTVESSIILTNYSGLVMATLMFIIPEQQTAPVTRS